MQEENSPLLLSISKIDQENNYVAKVQANDEVIKFTIVIATRASGATVAVANEAADNFFMTSRTVKSTSIKQFWRFIKGALSSFPLV